MKTIIIAGALLLVSIAAYAQEARMNKYECWVVDSCKRVIETDERPQDATGEIVLHVARGEKESVQVAVRPTEDSIPYLTARCSDIESEKGCKLPPADVRYVDSVPIRVNTHATSPDQLSVVVEPGCTGWLPSPLYDMTSIDVWIMKTRAIYITFDIPKDMQPGIYTGEVTVYCNSETIKVPTKLIVHSAVVPDEPSMIMTNWVEAGAVATWSGKELFSDEYFDELKIYAENIASHRQNMFLVPLVHFYNTPHVMKYRAEGDELIFDFSLFDRWVETFLDAGVKYIEGGHLSQHGRLWVYYVKDGKVEVEVMLSTEPRAREYLVDFLTALNKHLTEKGWKDIYYQHVSDEPNDEVIEIYNDLQDLVHKHLPGVKTMEATLSSKPEPDVIIPILSIDPAVFGSLEHDFELQKKRQESGKELWQYVCGAVAGNYATLNMDHKLIKARYLLWLNYKYGLDGFLFWGYNWWQNQSPFSNTKAVMLPNGSFPPGDHFLVYPAPKGVYDSLRWEALRDSQEDYELLVMLDKKDPEKAREICDSLIRGFADYELDVYAFREARNKLLESLDE